MCEGAEEIQKAWKPKEGDRFFWKSYNNTAGEMKINKLCIVGIGETEEVESWWNCIYLPTQEQLQEITLKYIDDLEVSYTNKDTPAIEANIWLKKDGKWDGFEPLFADDWNTLWLQIYMLMKCSKIWTGEKWVKAE